METSSGAKPDGRTRRRPRVPPSREKVICALLAGLPRGDRADTGPLHAAILGADGEVSGEVTVVGQLQLLHFTARMNSIGYRPLARRDALRSRYAVVLAPPTGS